MGNAFAHKARPQASAEGRGLAPQSLSAKTQRLRHDVLHSPGKPLDSETRADMEPRFRHDFSKVRVHADSNATALAINKPDDTFEQEADRVAERVMRTSEPVGPVGIENEPVVRRKCACGGTCSECDAERKVNLQRRAANTGEPATVPPIVHKVLREPGRPLDAATRAYMEPRFGHDFSGVKVHADAGAAQSSAEIGARAWTAGSHIAFGPGMYNPSTRRGGALLAHELAHVVQQQNLPYSAAALKIGGPDDTYEREAHTYAAAVAAGRRYHPASPPQMYVQASLLSGFLDVVLFVPRLFGLEVFPAEDLREYLAVIKQRKGPEDSIFSDNKARACVSRENEFGPYDTQTKIWLIQEMLGGYTSFLDKGAIITLLHRSTPEIPQIVSAIGRDKLWSEFSGNNRRIIEAITMTAADAGDALVERLRKLDPTEIQDFASYAVDPAVKEAARRAAALANITTHVDAGAAITPAGEADLTINGIKIFVQPDKFNPSLGDHGYTHGDFEFERYPQSAVTPENTNQDIPFKPLEIRLTIWTEFPSEEAKQGPSGYGAGPTLQAHERAHGNAWLEFVRQNKPPVFPPSPMPIAQFNAAVVQYDAAINDYTKRAGNYALKAGDCVGNLPTAKQLEGTGFTVEYMASICNQR